jgi:phosphoribosylformylglycinamidine synthase
VALTTDVTPRYCYADPFEGGKQAVAETWRNITAAGGKPLAITDCMNFGNPERPEIMAEFARAIEGMGEACLALEYPVVSGNVSLYNETNGEGILPTPAIGGVGLIADVSRVATVALKPGDDIVVLIGAETGHLGQSLYQQQATGRVEGAPPPVDLAAEKKAGDFVRRLIEAGVTVTVHDISDGGILVALAEMAIAGKRGLTFAPADGLAPHAAAFGEEQGRYLVGLSRDAATHVLDEAKAGSIPARIVSEVGGDDIVIGGEKPVLLSELRRAHEDWFPAFMGGKR